MARSWLRSALNLVPSILLVALWWVVAPPLEHVDGSDNWILPGCVLKAAAWVALFVETRRACGRVGRSTLPWRKALLYWLVPLVVVALPMMVWRDSVSDWIEGGGHLTSHRFRGDDVFLGRTRALSPDRLDHRAWMDAWQSGGGLLVELAWAAAVAGLLARLALSFGRKRPGLIAVMALVGAWGLSGVWSVAFGMLDDRPDLLPAVYDGVLSSPFFVDSALWVASGLPGRAIGALVLLALSAGSLAAGRHRRVAFTPKRVKK